MVGLGAMRKSEDDKKGSVALNQIATQLHQQPAHVAKVRAAYPVRSQLQPHRVLDQLQPLQNGWIWDIGTFGQFTEEEIQQWSEEGRLQNPLSEPNLYLQFKQEIVFNGSELKQRCNAGVKNMKPKLLTYFGVSATSSEWKKCG